MPDLIAAFKRGGSNSYDVAKALGKIGGAGIPALTEALGRETAIAAVGLAEAGPSARSALPALLDQLPRFRKKIELYGLRQVIEALVAIGPDAAAAVPDLVAMLLDENCPDNCAHALCGGLRAFGPAVLPFAPQLAEALEQPARADNHSRILELLTELVPHGFEGFAVFRDALRRATGTEFYASESYASMAESRRHAVTGAAIAGLAALGPAAEDAIPELLLALQTFQSYSSVSLRQKVVVAFGAIGTAAIPHIRAALNDSWADIRLAAIRALGETGDTSMETQEALRKIEADSNRQVRALATATLRNMGTKKRKRK